MLRVRRLKMAGNWRHGICFFGTGDLVAARKYDTMYPNIRRDAGQSRRVLARQCLGTNNGAEFIHRLLQCRASDGGCMPGIGGATVSGMRARLP